jgi:16S rRNA (guanine527-N7)-methyltransferase
MSVDVGVLEQWIDHGARKMGLLPAPEVCPKLARYLQLLAKWNATYNLTSIRDPREMVALHILDSLSLVPHIGRTSLIDVGTGPGLPGIPLAIWYPELPVALLDSNIKKTRFLTQVKIELDLQNVSVHHQRVEAHQGHYAQVVSRAFASLARMTHSCAHLLVPGGEFLAMKGVRPDQEMGELEPRFPIRDVQRLHVPGCEAERHLIIIAA